MTIQLSAFSWQRNDDDCHRNNGAIAIAITGSRSSSRSGNRSLSNDKDEDKDEDEDEDEDEANKPRTMTMTMKSYGPHSRTYVRMFGCFDVWICACVCNRTTGCWCFQLRFSRRCVLIIAPCSCHALVNAVRALSATLLLLLPLWLLLSLDKMTTTAATPTATATPTAWTMQQSLADW